jgi:hypothetical protein
VDRIIAFVRHKMNDDRDECLHGSLANSDDIFDYFPYRKRPDGGALVPEARRERASEIRPNLRVRYMRQQPVARQTQLANKATGRKVTVVNSVESRREPSLSHSTMAAADTLT